MFLLGITYLDLILMSSFTDFRSSSSSFFPPFFCVGWGGVCGYDHDLNLKPPIHRVVRTVTIMISFIILLKENCHLKDIAFINKI